MKLTYHKRKTFMPDLIPMQEGVAIHDLCQQIGFEGLDSMIRYRAIGSWKTDIADIFLGIMENIYNPSIMLITLRHVSLMSSKAFPRYMLMCLSCGAFVLNDIVQLLSNISIDRYWYGGTWDDIKLKMDDLICRCMRGKLKDPPEGLEMVCIDTRSYQKGRRA